MCNTFSSSRDVFSIYYKDIRETATNAKRKPTHVDRNNTVGHLQANTLGNGTRSTSKESIKTLKRKTIKKISTEKLGDITFNLQITCPHLIPALKGYILLYAVKL
jgi:hypothetical protein